MNNYKEVKEIGSGSFGKAILCVHKLDSQKYVVKKMAISNQAETELRHLSSLEDPYIVSYKEAFYENNCVHLVMEYCEGGDLANVIKQRSSRTPPDKLPQQQILDWTLQICLGLKYLHDNNIIHRDLKPANIFLSHDQQVRIGDFGVSRYLLPKMLALTVVGSPLYVSPEIIYDGCYDAKIDVWSLGCCVYEMMTFRTAREPNSVLRGQWTIGEMPVGEYSSELTTLTGKMLTIKAADRPTVQDILQDDVMKNTQHRLQQSAAAALKAYKFCKDIGEGAFGKAMLYEHKTDKQKYVIKRMDICHPKVKRVSDTELHTLSSLKHCRIVSYKEGFADKKYLYLVIQYCESGDLKSVIERQSRRSEKLSELQILDWTRQICLGLKFLHEHNVIHRDLKPENVFLTHDQQVKIGDFGLARHLTQGELAKTSAGTPLYFSPEIADNKSYDTKVDVWSLGCCVYELMALRTAVNAAMLLIRHLWIIKEMPKDTVEFYSNELVELTDKMLTIDPSDRPSVQDILQTPLLKNVANSHLGASSFPTVQVSQLQQLSHGFVFNCLGQLREAETGNEFQYDVYEGDTERNDKRYEEIAQSVTSYVHQMLESELKMEKLFLPVDAKEDEARSYVFITQGWKKAKKLLVLIQGSETARAGEWARRVIINDSLDAGSQIPWVEQGVKEGYDVLLLNPNYNSEEIGGEQVTIRGSEDSASHAVYVWDHVIEQSSVSEVVIVAHSYGGVNVVHLLNEHQEQFLSRVKAVAFIESLHAAAKNPPTPVRDFLTQHTKHWVASSEALDTPLKSGIFKKHHSPRVSAGDNRPVWTTWYSFHSIFAFFRQQLSPIQSGH